MAQFTKRLSAGGNQYDLILDVNQSSQSIANNTSAVSWSLWIRKNSGSGYSASDTKNWSVNIGGQTKSGTIAGYNFSGKNSISLGSGSFTIAHNSDGTKSISASGTFTDSGVTGIGSGTASGSLALTAIPRTSTFTIPSSFNVGSAFTVSITRASSSFTHWVRLSDGNTILFDTDSSVGTSQSVNVAANTLIARMSGVSSKAFTVTVWTYSGGTVIGNTSKTITANIPASTFTIPSSFNVGSAFAASISRVGSSLTNRIELVDGSTSLYLTDATSSASLSTNVAANTLIARMAGVKSKAFTVHLHTYNNNVWIAYTSKTITANIPTSTFTAPGSFTMGNAFTVSISRVGSLTHAIELWDGGTNIYTSGNTVATSGSPNVALSTLAARSPSAMSRTFRVDVDTYNGNTFIGKSSKNITAYVPSSVKPTIETVTASENVSSVASLVGAYVQTKSKLNLAISGASGIYGSTIRSFNITGVGHSSNSWSTVTGYLSVSGSQTITGTVTDSRGQTFSKSVVVNILPYTAPTLSDLSFRRTLANKTEAPLGDNATVSASVKVQSLIVNGVQKNSIKYNVQSAQSGGSFATKADTTSTDLTKSYSDVWVGYSVDHSYNFRVRAGDVFGFGGWSVGVIPTGVVTQQWGSRTTSFGKMIDNTSYNVQVGTGGLHSEGPIVDKNGSQMMGFRSVGSIDLNTLTTAGSYRLASGLTNAPPNADWSQLLVIQGGGDTIAQLLFPYSTNDVWRRSGNPSDVGGSGSWRPWTKVSIDGHTHAWSAITGKPGTFQPSSLPVPGNNLNNAMAPGFYHWATGVANTPTDYGSMVVTAWDGTGAAQTAEQLVMKNGVMWIRGKNNAAGSWSAWAMVPKAADYVIETGSNSNGTYEKWHSGKLVQKYAIAVSAGASVAWGSMFIKYINGTSWTFPVAFVSNQIVVTGSPENYSGIIQVDKISTTRANSVYVMRPASWATPTTVNLRAEGRWK